MDPVFIGSEALAAGVVTQTELRRFYRRVLPDVYGPRRDPLSLAQRTTAAWLWSNREAVISGLAASAMLGARDHLHEGKTAPLRGMLVTTAERTAFDLARRGSVGQAVARLDALARASHFSPDDVRALAKNHPHVTGLRRVGHVLDLVDAGAESPKETWVRLLLIQAGFPRPETQIPVLGLDGYPLYYLDMGWEDKMIAVEYDGDDHRERRRFGKDLVRSEYLAHRHWTHIRVMADHRRADILRRVRRAWESAPGGQ